MSEDFPRGTSAVPRSSSRSRPRRGVPVLPYWKSWSDKTPKVLVNVVTNNPVLVEPSRIPSRPVEKPFGTPCKVKGIEVGYDLTLNSLIEQEKTFVVQCTSSLPEKEVREWTPDGGQVVRLVDPDSKISGPEHSRGNFLLNQDRRRESTPINVGRHVHRDPV